MARRLSDNIERVFCILLIVVLSLMSGCRSTRHLTDKQFLVKKDRVVLKPDHRIVNQGEVKDNLSKMIMQKPNAAVLGIPLKLYLYNRRYNRLKDLPVDSLPKSVERPVIFDTLLMLKSSQNMKNYLFNQGYFYAKIRDTFTLSHNKAYITHTIHTGSNYQIRNINFNIDDSSIAALERADSDGTVLVKDKDFAYSLTDDERSRITAVVRNQGYYRFTQENVTFKIDTFDKTLFKAAESPFESAINFISEEKKTRKPTLDIDVIIRRADDSAGYTRYGISSVHVYPDYNGAADLYDSSMKRRKIDSVEFISHDEYVHARVLYEHIYIAPGNLYSQADYDKTIVKLNELGIFQYIRIQYHENRLHRNMLDCDIFLSRTKKHDFSTNYEVSSGSTYSLGNSLGLNYRDKNFMHGANLMTIGVNGGLELGYNTGKNFIDNFSILTKYYGVNASIDFPKFIAPVSGDMFGSTNLPHTIIGGGENVIDRVHYFTLINTSANLSYNWHMSRTITWNFSPAFVNIIRVPNQSDSFKKVLAGNEYLQNSYKENFIEGENLSFTFSDLEKRRGRNYSYLKLSIEEAGALLQGLNDAGSALIAHYKTGNFAQYTKFDFDGRHYFTFPKSVFAFRFYGGIGDPYGQSVALPYIKQYFAGGPYSLRGWRIRTLGPGSYYSPGSDINQIDRTADIKLEMNGEYRFPITPLFAGAIKMNGALFADAGNIWLAKKDTSYAGGEFALNTLGQDIAMDVGGGIRFDIAQFLTLRIDVAVPVKKPYIPENGGWVFSSIDPYNSTWRANNIIFNVSIGYPF